MLRAVRFASRFGFQLDDSLLAAASDDEVRDALGHKVSRERVGAELDGMLTGPDPASAVHLLQQLRLFEAVFEVHPSAGQDITEEFADAGTALLTAAWDVLAAWSPPEAGAAERRFTLLAALLLPLRHAIAPGPKGKPQSMASHIIRDSLKWKVRDCEAVDTLHAVSSRLLISYSKLKSLPYVERDNASNVDQVPEDSRIEFGRCLRQLKDLWIPGIVLASLLPSPQARPLGVFDILSSRNKEGEALRTPEALSAALHVELTAGRWSCREVESRVAACREIVHAAEKLGLSHCWEWKPLLDGKAVMALVGMKYGGPALGQLMEKVLDWQLAHPGGSKEECEAWIKLHHAKVMANDGL